MKRFIFPLISLSVIVLELVLCFTGPMALTKTPSLYIAPLLNVGGSDEDLDAAYYKVEQTVAQTKSFDVISRQLLEDYLIDRGTGKESVNVKKQKGYKEHLAVARDLGVDRLLLSILTVTRKRVELVTILRDVESGDILVRNNFASASMEDLLNEISATGKPLDMVEAMTVGTNGISVFDLMFFFLIFCQILYTLFYIFKKTKRGYEEFLIFLSFMLFLFAYIYALNANMSYVQRFIAMKGELGMAESTEMEQLFAAVRFLPFLFINLFFYIKKGIVMGKTTSFRERLSRWALPLAMGSAFLSGIAYPSFLSLDGFGALAWVALIPLFLLLHIVSWRRGVFYGLVYGALQATIINYWHGTFNYIALPFSTILIVLQYVPFMMILVGLMKVNNKHNYLLLPVAWVIFDYLRSIGFTGYPWGLIGATQYSFTWFIQLASVTGVWGLSFLVVLCNSTLTHMLLHWRDRKLNRPFIFFLILFVMTLIWGGLTIHFLEKEEPRDTARLSLIQQNSDPRRHDYNSTFETLTRLTNEAIESWGEKPDLVVWPEGAFKSDIRYWQMPEYKYSNRASLVNDFLKYVKDNELWLITGSQDHEFVTDDMGEEQRNNFNAGVFLNPQGEIVDIYHKIQLVPFSEYFPYQDELPFIAGLLEKFDTSNWTVGQRKLTFQHPKFGFNTPICFEDVFPGYQRGFMKNNTDIIVNITNDFWSLTPVEAKQHGVHALFRTVENRRPMVRATCSGYTVYFDRFGRIISEAEGYYTEAYLNVEVPLYESRPTLYSLYGDWFPYYCAIMVFILLIYNLIKRRKQIII